MKTIKRVFMLLIVGIIFLSLIGFIVRHKPQKQKSEQLKSEEVQEIEKFVGVPFSVELLEIGDKRPAQLRKVKYIVIHNTANAESSARNERDYLSNPNNTSSTGWHIVVDEDEMIQAIPTNEIAFHAGTQEGNHEGIGIEICEKGHEKTAEQHAARLTAYLMKKYDVPISNVVPHQYFSGKQCPRKILDHWEHFKQQVEKAYNEL